MDNHPSAPRWERAEALRPTWDSAGSVIVPAWPCTWWGLPGRRVTAPPVRSYRTISPLPATGSRVARHVGGVFLWHFPAGFPGAQLATTTPYGVRTFLEDGFLSAPRLSSQHAQWYASGRLVARACKKTCPKVPYGENRAWTCCGGRRVLEARAGTQCGQATVCSRQKITEPQPEHCPARATSSISPPQTGHSARPAASRPSQAPESTSPSASLSPPDCAHASLPCAHPGLSESRRKPPRSL